MLLSSSVEAAYVLFMFNWFETSVNFENRPCYFESTGWTHDLSTMSYSKICPNGKKISYVVAAYLLGRNFWKFNPTLNTFIVVAGGIFSFFMNKNSFVYLLVFATELFF